MSLGVRGDMWVKGDYRFPFLFSPQKFQFRAPSRKRKQVRRKKEKMWVTKDWTYDPVRVVREPRHRSRSKGTRGVHGSTRVGHSESNKRSWRQKQIT